MVLQSVVGTVVSEGSKGGVKEGGVWDMCSHIIEYILGIL